MSYRKVLIATTLFCILLSVNSIAQQKTIPEFIKEHPDRSSIYLMVDGKVLASVNPDKMMPLASTVKTIVAIEYAHQAANGTIDPASLVDTATLNHYYIPNTDGGAQPGWIKDMSATGKLKDGKVALEEVAKGMINYSSNANTEYLLDLLGLENINNRVKELAPQDHENLYYFISALLLVHDKPAEEVNDIPIQDYVQRSNGWHEKAKTNRALVNQVKNINFDVQKIWSDRLPRSTTKVYTEIMQKINSRTYFDKDVQKHIDVVMEGLMQNPANRKWLEHAGTKGGSTVWILTKALYATTKSGTKIEMAYFFNDLTIKEQITLQKSLNKFELAVLTNKDGIRDEIVELLK